MLIKHTVMVVNYINPLRLPGLNTEYGCKIVYSSLIGTS